MDSHELEKFKKRLLFEKQVVLHHLEHLSNGLELSIDFTNGDIVEDSLADPCKREKIYLKKIERALEKLETNKFGVCEECALRIDIERLEAKPFTSVCIQCKTQKEQKESKERTDKDLRE